MRVLPRTQRARLALIARGLSLILFATAVALQHHPLEALSAVALGLALLPIAWRRKAPVAPGAVYTSSADQLLPNGRHRPGQLSLTTTTLTWLPSDYAVKHGGQAISIDARRCRAIALERGVGLLDVLLTVTPVEGEAIRLLTHSSRHLETAIDDLDERRRTVAPTSGEGGRDSL
jgi:hypothetical protein